LIIGNPSVLAIESSITKAYERLSFRGLGFFVIHVGGLSYGRRAPDSTMLACSYEEVERRVAMRGSHSVPFALEADATKIATAFRDAIYSENQKETYFGIPTGQFAEIVYSKRIMWAPDGDEAFDDSSYILQFDIEDRVRLIAFKCVEKHFPDPRTIRDISLAADDFYDLLKNWHDAFHREWGSMAKTSETDYS
jgi:hypothetical protein